MRDYWNDPPECPEPPACPNDKGAPCPGSGEYLYDGKSGMVFSCDVCAYQWVIPFECDPEPIPNEPEAIPEDDTPRPCPHGKIDQCDACDYLGDIAYDSERERRFFGR